MNDFFNVNKTLITSSLIALIVIPIFGLKFLFTFLGNILLIAFLIPVLLLLLTFIGFNSLKSKINICGNCGALGK